MSIIKSVIKIMMVFNSLLFLIGRLLSPLLYIMMWTRHVSCKIYSGMVSVKFKRFGKNTLVNSRFQLLKGANYISIGNSSYLGSFIQLTAWSKFRDQNFTPSIQIGDNTSLGDYSHITCINKISIGNNVRCGKRILITDNSHGLSERNLLHLAPNHRPLYSKGPVIIEDNVWIGENSCILPGVTIGRGAIIGANSVVTKNVPEFTVVGGNPAKIIKQM